MHPHVRQALTSRFIPMGRRPASPFCFKSGRPRLPVAVQVCQRRPVLSHGQRPGFEPPHLRARGRLRIDSTPAHNLAHDGIKGQPVGIVYILVASEPPIDGLPEQPVKPMDGVLARAAVAQDIGSEVRQPERVVELAHHQAWVIEPAARMRTKLKANAVRATAAILCRYSIETSSGCSVHNR